MIGTDTTLTRPEHQQDTPYLREMTSRLDFVQLLDQHGRFMQVQTALPALSLIAERMVLRELVSQPFELELQCLSTSANFELKSLLGEQVSLRLLQANGQYKSWHGYVFEAAQLGSEGGLARYQLHMRPWLAALAYRRNSRVFHDQNAQQIVSAVLGDHLWAHFRFDVTEALRVRSLCTQYRETDLAFVQRVLAQEGLSYHFEHLDDEAAAQADDASHARHVMVITDQLAQRPDLGSVRFSSQHASANLGGQKDAITAFMSQRDIGANAVTLGAWDYKKLAGVSAQEASALALGDLPALEVYDGSGAYRYQDPEHAQRAAQLALAALELDFKHFEGQGSTRHFSAGMNFSLIDHPLYGANTSAFNYSGSLLASHQRPDNAFTLLSVEHHCTNNLGSDLAALLHISDLERGTYKNHFHCAPAAAAVVPRYRPAPTAHGAQSAIIVGLPNEPLQSERDHRVKIRFAWQDASGDFPANADGAWVRVALPWAGANWGAALVPRIGAEVVVEFIEGDIDRPIITGSLYNGADAPPFSAGVDSGVNHSGVISGWHSGGLDGSGFNQWALDDATAQLRMRLLCSYTLSEVGLGHLIGQSAQGAQRGAWRGAGFEAGTAGWASVRSGKGLLISTSARAGTYGSAQSTQMDATQALAQLRSAKDLGQRLSDAAAQSQAQALHSPQGGNSLERFMSQIDPAQQGKLAGPLNGQSTLHDPQGSRDLKEPVHAFGAPVMVFDTPSSAALTSQTQVLAYAGEGLGFVSQGDVQHSAAHTASQVSGQTTSFFTHAGGLQVKAANGPLSLRAHTDALQILASKEVQILSVNDEITISAKNKIELIGGDSGLTLEGGNITFTTPGTWAVKGASHAFSGGGNGAASLSALPDSRVNLFDEQVRALSKTDGKPIAGLSYRIETASGEIVTGTTDESGKTMRTATATGEALKIHWTDTNNEMQAQNGDCKEC